MPTGYTRKIFDGTCKSVIEYINGCMDAFIGSGRGIDHEESVSYHLEKVKEAREELLAFENADRDKLYEKYKKEQWEEWEKSTLRQRELSQRYEEMIEKIGKWNYPPELKAFRDFCFSQLIESKEFDCYSPSSPRIYTNADEWGDSQRAEMRRIVDYHEKEWQKSVAALERVTKFQQTVEESLRGLDGDV